MSTLNDKLNLIKDARDDIQTALAGKGQVVGKDIRDYAEAVANIEGGSGDVKLFDTVEHMQQDETAQEGDLAVVYREEIQPVTSESEFDSCIFPNEVVLSEAFTDSISGMFRAVDDSWFDGMVDMSSSNFRFDGWGESSQIRVQYTSQDGITYTRTDGGEELQEFGTTIKWGNYEPFNSVIGNFMKIGGNYFDGMYEYGNYLDLNYHSSFININSIIKDGDYFVASIGKFIPDLYNIRNTRPYVVLQKFSGIFQDIDFCEMTEAYELSDRENWIGSSRENPSGVVIAKDLSTNKFTLFYVKHSTDEQHPDIQSIKIGHYSNNTLIEEDKNVSYYGVSTYVNGGKFYFYKIDNITEVVYVDDIYFSYSGSGSLDFNVWQYYSTTDVINGPQYLGALKYDFGINYNKYNLISSQLDATPDYVYEKTFYGKNGIEIGALQNGVVYNDTIKNIYINIANMFTDTGLVIKDGIKLSNLSYTELPFKIDTSTMTDMYNMFHHCTNLTTIPLLDTSNVTDMNSMFYSCNKLSSIPLLDTSNVTDMHVMFFSCNYLTTIPLLDTSNVTTMDSMFHHCTSLTTIPLIDTSSVTNMERMFNNCTSLTAIPLLNTSNVTTMYEMLRDCTSLTTIPQLDTSSVTNINSMLFNCTSLTTIPLIDTSNATSMIDMFHYCSSLTTIPLLNTSNITNMYNTFNGCTSLNNDSLNNILAMCTNATKITSHKTLRYIGLTQAQATVCQSLSNYSAFTSAGWTTGY